MNLCVFCGALPGRNPVYLESAKKIGRLMVERGLTLVYGGGSLGMMGMVASTVMEAGGVVIGVMPQHLIELEGFKGEGLSQFHIVNTMHERKMKMAELSDGFIALPGGPGTLEEIFEQWTWSFLGIHNKPCVFYNVNGYYDHLRRMVDHGFQEGFIRQSQIDRLFFTDDSDELFSFFKK